MKRYTKEEKIKICKLFLESNLNTKISQKVINYHQLV
ncbi:hypothetical protein SCORR_v1c01270 [Spiroplasma corruscae]|uniref:Transposase n=1 Tax=Spiroplasma corruscae TaxID=216934 RepID=A0A222EN24_9MOLU|nr:hypothetical protein SCORR_v1c01270 [Spiroplasma corruscae]